jgi:type II secretory pathway pseudopilin PulG
MRGLCFADTMHVARLPQSRSSRGRRADGGFTRIEAVLVVATTALVGALAATALRTYLIRAQVAESIELAKHARDQVTRAFRRTGTPPGDREDAGFSNDGPNISGRYVAETRISNGRVDLVFGGETDGALAGRTLSLTPFETADQQVVWVCGSKQPGVGLKPLGFAGGGPLAVQPPPTIEPRYLPPACR